MDADEHVAVRRAVARPVVQVDQRVAGAREHGGEPAPRELGPQQLRDRQGDVLLRQRAGKVAAGVAGVATAVTRIDDDRMRQPQAGDRIDGRRDRRGDGDRGGFGEPPRVGVPAVARHRARQTVGEPHQRQEQAVPSDIRVSGEGAHGFAGARERGAQLEDEGDTAHPHRRLRAAHLRRQPQRDGQTRCRHRRRTALRRERDRGHAARRRDDHRLQRGDREQQRGEQDHARLRTARAISRSASRRFKSSRLSNCFFGRASAIATLATPRSLK